jgi:hypothetical protein
LALLVSITTAVYGWRSYHRAGARVRAKCRTRNYNLEAGRWYVTLTLSNTGLAEISVKKFGFVRSRQYYAIPPGSIEPLLNAQDPPRLKPNQDLEWIIDMRPMVGLIQRNVEHRELFKANIANSQLGRPYKMRFATKEIARERFRRAFPPAGRLVAELGGGQAAIAKLHSWDELILRQELGLMRDLASRGRLIAGSEGVEKDEGKEDPSSGP